MVQQTVLFLCLLFNGLGWAQDERYYRQILSGDLPRQGLGVQEATIQQFNVSGPSYHLDLNGDGLEEAIIPQKRDGVDWIEIQDSTQRKIFEAKLFAMGSESALYKVKLVNISERVKALILFLDEGKTAGLKFESTARLYLATYEDNNLSSMKLTTGPHFFHEKEAQREQYYRRDYQVNVRDLNNDKVREIVVEYGHIQRILIYQGNGNWKRF